MRKTLVTIAALGLSWLSANAQQISANQSTIDCGQVVFNHPVKVDYQLRNTATKPLVITKVLTSCGCAEVTYPKNAIAAGAEFTLSATYDARQMGHFEKLLGVYGTTSDEPLMLTLKGVVVDAVEEFSGEYPYTVGDFLTDIADIEFDDVNRGDMPIVKLHIKNNTDETLSPVVLHLPNYLRATVSPAKLAPHHSGIITLKLDSRGLHDFGLTQTNVFLGSEASDKVAPEKEITVSAVLLPGFNMTEQQRQMAPIMKLSDKELNLGSFGKKKKLKGQIKITNEGKSPLEISSLQLFTAGLQVQLNKRSIQPGETARLKVTAIKDQLKGVRTSPRVLMITNDPDNPKVILNVKTEE
ncbi:MAG: DUF1573 domain-containing protein [Prevotella sp.]|jgi:hypothetical protein